jgi:hydrogenase maturation factor HypF (carbamoyltransferase family)
MTARIRPGETFSTQQGSRESLPALCDVALCHICGRAFIDATGKRFPVPYVCWDCDPQRKKE